MVRYRPYYSQPRPRRGIEMGEPSARSERRIVVPVRSADGDLEYITPPRGLEAVTPEREARPRAEPTGSEEESLLDTNDTKVLQRESGAPTSAAWPADAEERERPGPDDSGVGELEERHDVALEALHGFRDRSEARVARRHREEQDAMLSELLPIIDNLDRALRVERAEENPWYEGLASIRRQFLDFLAKRDVSPFDALGRRFDPHFHDALCVVKDEDVADGCIAGVEEAGYMRGPQLLRPAKVAVAQNPEA